MGGYTPANKPACTQEYWPGNGGSEASSFEPDGAAGNKMDAGSPLGSMASEEGQYNTAAQAANAAAHGRPAVTADPEVTQVPAVGPHGGIDGPDPYSLTDYPHAGPPARTTGVGSTQNTVGGGE